MPVEKELPGPWKWKVQRQVRARASLSAPLPEASFSVSGCPPCAMANRVVHASAEFFAALKARHLMLASTVTRLQAPSIREKKIWPLPQPNGHPDHGNHCSAK